MAIRRETTSRKPRQLCIPSCIEKERCRVETTSIHVANDIQCFTSSAVLSDRSEKIKKYVQKYKDEYSKQYSCIVKSSKRDDHAFCAICSAYKSIVHGGLSDVKQHVGTIKYVTLVKSRFEAKSITSFCGNDDLILFYLGVLSPFSYTLQFGIS